MLVWRNYVHDYFPSDTSEWRVSCSNAIVKPSTIDKIRGGWHGSQIYAPTLRARVAVYLLMTAKDLLSDKRLYGKVDSSTLRRQAGAIYKIPAASGAFVPSPSLCAMTQTASRAARLVRRATDGPVLEDSFDSSP